jgi:hypothetical protein
MRICDFSIVSTRNYVVFFRNYGSQCDRSYAVTAPQFHRNEVHGFRHVQNRLYSLNLFSVRTERLASDLIGSIAGYAVNYQGGVYIVEQFRTEHQI